MADDETSDASTDESTDADATTDENEAVDTSSDSSPPKERSGVHLPVWALVALVVVAALAIGGVGYAIGHSGDDSINLNTPIADVRRAPRTQDDGGACPDPMGGRGGGPGEQLRPGPGGMPGAPLGPGYDHDDSGTGQDDNPSNDQ